MRELEKEFYDYLDDAGVSPKQATAKSLAAIAGPYLAKAEPHEEILKLAQALYDCQPFVNEYMSERCYPLYSPYRESLSKAAEPKEQKPLDDEMLVKNIASKILESDCSILSFEDQARAIIKLVGAAKDAEIERLRLQLAACGVLAMANTRERLAAQRITGDNPLWCASIQDVIDSTEREIKERDRAEKAEAELAEVKSAWAELDEETGHHPRGPVIALQEKVKTLEAELAELKAQAAPQNMEAVGIRIFRSKEDGRAYTKNEPCHLVGDYVVIAEHEFSCCPTVLIPTPETESEAICRELREAISGKAPSVGTLERALKYIEAKG